MTARRTRRPHLPGDEAGVTLVELLVTMVLLSVLGGLVVQAVLGINRTVAVAEQTTYDQGFARNALTLVSRNVRAAAAPQQSTEPAFRHATPGEAEFTALLGTGQRTDLVRVEVDATRRLVVTQTPSDPASSAPNLVYDPGDARVRPIADGVVNPVVGGVDQVFRYFDVDGNELTDFSGPGGSLTLAQRTAVTSVEMTVLLNRSPRQSEPVEVVTRVRLPNAGARN